MRSLIHVSSSDYLAHYGIKGQKWGIRRYQNENGTLTAAGKKRAKQEYKSDNKEAFELGKNATIYGHAAAKSTARTIKIEKKLDKQYEKDPEGAKRRTQSLKKKWDASSATTLQLLENYNKYKDKAEQHCKSLIDKYGKEAVAEISYKEKKLPKGEFSPKSFKTINESTSSVSDYAIAGAMSLTSTAMMGLMGAPFYMVYTPKTTGQKASEIESTVYRGNREALKKKL